MDEQGDEPIMKKGFFREADGFAREPFEAGAERQVLAFQAVQLGFIFLPLLGRQPVAVGPPGIGNPVLHLYARLC